MGCGDNYDSRYGQYYGCSEGYNYYYGKCCDEGMALWVSILIWTSSFLLCCLLFSLLFAGVRRRRRRMYRGRLVSTDTYDSLYEEPPQQTRVIYVNGQNAPPQRRGSDTIRTYTTSPKNAYPPLPQGMRPLVDTSKPKTTIRITLYTG